MVQQHLGQQAHVAHMETALPVAELHDVAEDFDHHGVLLFFFIDLVGQQAHQLFLFSVEQDGVDHPAVDHQGVKGAVDEVGTPQAVGPLHVGGGGFGGDHDDRHIVDPAVLVHDLQDLEPVHIGHHDIQEQEVDFRLIFPQDLHGLLAVLRLDNFVLVAEHVRQNGAVHFRVVSDQYFLLSSALAIYGSHTPFKVTNLQRDLSRRNRACRAVGINRKLFTVIIAENFAHCNTYGGIFLLRRKRVSAGKKPVQPLRFCGILL